ncbi:protelomerase family protein [Fischerella sp. PCC 9605]|uniref:protelomerase family protein n=1 Tax=Fischerella sp. PCC 9605 TaxID=1173024 RepID=UPI0004B7382B|nr:protelomerase family protein [Fischerella sp. PCC 9605]
MKSLTPQQYFEKIKLLRTPEEIQVVCEELTDALFGSSNYAPKTRANMLIAYNKVINEGFSNDDLVEGENAFIYTKDDGTLWKRHLHFKFTGLTKDEWKEINAKTIVLDRLENRREVKVYQYLETTCKLLLSDDPHSLAVGLIAASGRRPVEILARGSFTLAKELPEYLKHGYFVNFRGQVKKRDYDMPVSERAEYRIGVLVPAEFFVAAFDRFRKMPSTKELLRLLKDETKKGTDPEVINDMIESLRGGSLRRVVAREFASFLPARFGEAEVNNKSLRAVYVRLITDRDCPKTMADILWASRSVGHFIDNQKPDDSQLRHLLTTLGYFDYYALEEVPFISAPSKEKEILRQVRVSQEAFEFIKSLQEKWDLPNQQAVIDQLIKTSHEVENLKKQLLEAQAKITQLQQEQQSMSITPKMDSEIRASDSHEITLNQDELEALIERKVEEVLNKRQPQQPPSQTKTSQQNQTPQKPSRDWESISSEELKPLRTNGAVDEKIRRAFLAITNYNDAQPSNASRWVINNQALRQLSGCNGQRVSSWMAHHKISIDDHNNKYGLGQYHNKGRGDITEVISW